MSDFNSSLPVRTQNAGDVAVQLVDGTVTTQKLAIDSSGRIIAKLDDGSGNVITSQVNGAQRALDVGIDVAGVQIDPRSIRTLTSADVVTANQGTAGAAAWLTKDAANGSAAGGTAATSSELVGGVFNTTPPTLTTGQQAAIQLDSSGNVKTALTAALPTGNNIIGRVEVTDGTGTSIGSTSGALNVAVTQALPNGANAIGSVLANVQVAGAAVTAANPLPVTMSASVSGTAIQQALTSASLAVGASATLTYTVVAAHTFNLQRIFAAASGKIKVVVQLGATTIFVGFNSTANPNVDITVISPPLLAAASTVNVIITNLDILAQDVYATVEGNQN